MHVPFSGRAFARVLAVAAFAAVALPASASANWQRGVNFNTYWPNAYSASVSDSSLARVAADGNDSVEIVVTWYSADANSTQVAPDPSRTPTDTSVLHAMQTARSLGLNVVLKPHVNINSGSWRGGIHPTDTAAWFASYQGFIDHYADLAQQGGATMLVVGDELKSMSSWNNASSWQSIITGIRQRFSGKLTYAANYDEYKYVSFWNQLDYLGVDAYFPLASTSDPSVSDLVSAWSSRGYLADLQRASSLTGKPVLFTEIGYRSEPDTATHPGVWNTTTALDTQAQANAYEAAYEAFAGRPWFAGMYWWNWPAVLPADGQNSDYPSFMKPAEGVMTSWNSTLAGQ